MKKAIILHGTDGHPKENWFDWLKVELEHNGWTVSVPQLPQADQPNVARYNQFLLEEHSYTFDEETVLIGHSSGAVAILGLLQELPEEVVIDRCYLIGAFKDDLGWDSLKGLFETEFDFEKIKSKAQKFVFIHSENDPYCPLEHAQFLSHKLDGELIVINGQKHFSVGSMGNKYQKFPQLLQMIVNRSTQL